MSAEATNGPAADCVEHERWTAVPSNPPTAITAFTLTLKEVDPKEHERIQQTGVLTFHLVGCSGDFSNHAPQRSVAQAMGRQAHAPGPLGLLDSAATGTSFLFHLGDVVYRPDAHTAAAPIHVPDLYNAQFYAPYADYPHPIFAIAGNHDGTFSPQTDQSPIDHFLKNFCAASSQTSADNATDQRPAMTQPHVYWRLSTPVAEIIGLYSNIAHGGILDDPTKPETPQYDWLVAQLRDVRATNQQHPGLHKAVVLAVHYPPYSGTANFPTRGDPTLGSTPGVNRSRPLAVVLEQAAIESGQRPDVVISAHAHLYQRLTWRDAEGWEVPYLIAGSGGHAPLEGLWHTCEGTEQPSQALPFAAVLPRGCALASRQQVQVVAYNDQAFGFVRLTIGGGMVSGEFFVADHGQPALVDAFRLDLARHRLVDEH